MSLLKPLGTGQAYLKGGCLGFQKSGKTYTATLLACAVRKFFELKGPIAMYDTEGGSEYVAPTVKKLTGTDLVGIKSRDFEELVRLGQECVSSGVSVLIADSMTHVWRSLCDAYLKGLNDARRKTAESKGWNFRPKASLEFQDWGPVKNTWAKWTDFYLNAPLHIIICGRAGYEYDMQQNEDSGKKELVKTGIKMKTEGEFGFEPSLLFEMESEQEPDGNGGFKFVRSATVLGDRYNLIDGKTAKFASVKGNQEQEMENVFDFFGPHIQMLKPGAHSEIKTQVKAMDVDESGDAAWAAEKKTRTIICEEVQGIITSVIPGQSAEDKKKKTDLVQEIFGTRSWTAVESMESSKLRDGLSKLKAKFNL